MTQLEHLLGPMLGANFLYVHGELMERRFGEQECVHEFWGYRNDRWRTERSDGLTFIDAPSGSVTLHRKKILERSTSRHHPGFHLAERLLRPIHAPIWGRKSDDWRLTRDSEDLGSGLLRVGLVRTAQPAERAGSIDVDPTSGRLWAVTTPAFTWQLQWLEEESVGDPDGLFPLPADPQADQVQGTRG